MIMMGRQIYIKINLLDENKDTPASHSLGLKFASAAAYQSYNKVEAAKSIRKLYLSILHMVLIN